jgi:hypothetical protein
MPHPFKCFAGFTRYFHRIQKKTYRPGDYSFELYYEFFKTSPSMDRIRQLVKDNPYQVKGTDPASNISGFAVVDDFEIPLHTACRAIRDGRVALAVVQYLVKLWPESVKTTSNDGSLPLHNASCCMHKNNAQELAVVQYLVEQWPESVKTARNDGSLPLHAACMHKAPLAVVQYLVEQWPESVQRRNSEGETPLDILAARQERDAADTAVIN